jgi:hypothetical protein
MTKKLEGKNHHPFHPSPKKKKAPTTHKFKPKTKKLEGNCLPRRKLFSTQCN